MPLGDYLVGMLFAAVVFGAAGAAAVIVVIRRGSSLPLPVAVAAAALLGTTGVFVCHLIPGMLGVLSRETAAAAALAVLAAATLVPAAPRVSTEVTAPPPSSRVSSVLGIGALAAAAVYLLAMALDHGGDVPVSPDTVTFHLPNVARWIQSGSFWQVDDFVPNRALGNYPETADVLHLATILPWRSDFLMPLSNYPLTALLGLALFCCARELRAPVPAALLVTGAVLAMPVIGYLTSAGLSDHAMYAAFSCGVLFLLRHWRTGDPFDLMLAGTGLGMSFGMRWYALPAVVAVVAVWAGGWLAARRPVRQLVRQAGAIVGLVAALGGFWLVRNWVESGNPFFPVRVELGGLVLFDAPRDIYREINGFRLLDYADDPSVWRHVLGPTFVDLLAVTSVLLLAGVAAAAVVATRRLRGMGPDSTSAVRVLGLAAVALLVVLAYSITPYTAAGPDGDPREAWVNTRYVVPALLVAAPATAWLLGCARGFRVAVEVVLVLATIDALRRSARLPEGDVGAPAIAGAIVVAGALTLALAWRPRALSGPLPKRPLLAAGAAVVIAVLAAGALHADRYSDDRYRDFNPVVDYVQASAASGARIGLVGDGFSNYPLFGPDLDNEVEFVGRRVDQMLRPFDEAHAFQAAISRGGYDLVYFQDLDTVHPQLAARQEGWLRDAGYRQVATGIHLLGTRIALYEPPLTRGDEPDGTAG